MAQRRYLPMEVLDITESQVSASLCHGTKDSALPPSNQNFLVPVVEDAGQFSLAAGTAGIGPRAFDFLPPTALAAVDSISDCQRGFPGSQTHLTNVSLRGILCVKPPFRDGEDVRAGRGIACRISDGPEMRRSRSVRGSLLSKTRPHTQLHLAISTPADL